MLALTIGVDDLEDKDLLVLRSTLRLRSEKWSWVDALVHADVWVVDVTRSMRGTPADALGGEGVIRVVAELPAEDRAAPPWAGRQLRLLHSPKLARYPVTVEMLGWLHMMGAKPVRYETLQQALPLDRALVDETGAALQAPAASKKGFRWSLLKR